MAWEHERDPFEPLRTRCLGLVVVEIPGLGPPAFATFTPRERRRYESLAPRRQPGYLAARIALKRLWNELLGGGQSVEALAIETVGPDMTRPCCIGPNGARISALSISHDRSYAVAVAGGAPVGIDVETESDTLLKGRHLFMRSREQALVRESPLGQLAAATRVWTVKEAASKALDLELPQAWRDVEVRSVGHAKSETRIRGSCVVAHHAQVSNHVFTLLELPFLVYGDGMPERNGLNCVGAVGDDEIGSDNSLF